MPARPRLLSSFTNARILLTELTNANLTNANLTDADLTAANLTAADLSHADLTGANLSRANLTDTNNLTQEQLDSACVSEFDGTPTLPEGLNSPQTHCGPGNQ